MRLMFVVVLGAFVLSGCKHPSSSEAGRSTDRQKKRTEKTSTRPAGSQPAQARPLNEPLGKVASVNADLRFVVIDFSMNPVPRADQKMSVYRQGQKVGELKVSIQSRNSIVAADLIAGEAQVGDEVRAD